MVFTGIRHFRHSDRATAYYHAALADSYEDMATNYGRQEFFTRAIEEYKLAINADPDSPELAIGLAELYLRAGRIAEAFRPPRNSSRATKTTSKRTNSSAASISAHSARNKAPAASPAPGNQMLDEAIAEFVKIVSLEPKSLEDRLLLGQLYTVKHDTAKAEAQFKAAQAIEPASEDVILNLARLYAENPATSSAPPSSRSRPVDDRTTKEEFALGAAYEQLKDSKKAIAAYQRSVDMEPENLDAARALAQALLADNQLDEALKQFKQLSEADPEDSASLDRISEIQRRQGKYTKRSPPSAKLAPKIPNPLKPATTRACCSMSSAAMTKPSPSTKRWSTRPVTPTAHTPRKRKPIAASSWNASAPSTTRKQDHGSHRRLPEDDRS
jgi:tetratricopeptide (TPR) repeat protein